MNCPYSLLNALHSEDRRKWKAPVNQATFAFKGMGMQLQRFSMARHAENPKIFSPALHFERVSNLVFSAFNLL
jgi:hypothetical protein